MKITNVLIHSVAMLALISTTAFAEEDATEPVMTEKLVRIRPAQSSGSGSGSRSHGLHVDLSTEKRSYYVNEAIRFKVRLNRPAYLYFFNMDPATGKAVVVLPNRIQSNREIKYPGDYQWRLVPNSGLEFYSDRPGVERMVMVASEKYLDVNRLKRTGNTKSVGDFFAMDNPLDALDGAINDAYNGEGSSEKAIRIRETNSPRLPKGIVIKEVNLRIR